MVPTAAITADRIISNHQTVTTCHSFSMQQICQPSKLGRQALGRVYMLKMRCTPYLSQLCKIFRNRLVSSIRLNLLRQAKYSTAQAGESAGVHNDYLSLLTLASVQGPNGCPVLVRLHRNAPRKSRSYRQRIFWSYWPLRSLELQRRLYAAINPTCLVFMIVIRESGLLQAY